MTAERQADGKQADGKDGPARRGAPADLAPGPRIILMAPQMGENIGATARAMLNFGLTELTVVSPRDGWPNDKAIAMASGADWVLEAARVVDDLASALADIQYVLATAAKPREMLLPVYTPEAGARELRPRVAAGQACAILFGAERSGLTNESILKCDGIVSIPVNPAFPSLNLAQSVLLMAYEWARAAGVERPAGDLDLAAPAPKADFDRLIAHLFKALEAANYFFPPERRPQKERNLIAALARAGLTEGEVRTLRGVIKALSKRR